MSFNEDLNVLKVGKVRIDTGKEFQCFGARTRILFNLFYKIVEHFIDYFTITSCVMQVHIF